jgi:hypothetical protein
MKLPAVAYTIVDDRYFYPVGAHIFINTFKRFHPDIPLVVFRQDMIDKIFAEKKINFYMAKPTFAKLLTDKYDLVVNIDADTVVTGRMVNVFDKEYHVGGAWNKNDYEDASFDEITPEMYVQAGLVGSREPHFWDIWEEANKDAMQYIRQENDVLNAIWYRHPDMKHLNKVIYDKDEDYYGCKSLGREQEFEVYSDALWCRGEQVVAYHHAKGARFPKLHFESMPFSDEVKRWLRQMADYGKTVTIE